MFGLDLAVGAGLLVTGTLATNIGRKKIISAYDEYKENRENEKQIENDNDKNEE